MIVRLRFMVNIKQSPRLTSFPARLVYRPHIRGQPLVRGDGGCSFTPPPPPLLILLLPIPFSEKKSLINEDKCPWTLLFTVKCTVRNWYVEQYVAVVHQFHLQQQQQRLLVPGGFLTMAAQTAHTLSNSSSSSTTTTILLLLRLLLLILP